MSPTLSPGHECNQRPGGGGRKGWREGRKVVKEGWREGGRGEWSGGREKEREREKMEEEREEK